jgi:response regulator RpfG family c-di-GMP phosphodiesterase
MTWLSVLLLDRGAYSRARLAECLAAENMEVIEASDRYVALEIVRKRTIHALVVDLYSVGDQAKALIEAAHVFNPDVVAIGLQAAGQHFPIPDLRLFSLVLTHPVAPSEILAEIKQQLLSIR